MRTRGKPFKCVLLGATMLMGGYGSVLHAQDAAPKADTGDQAEVVVITGFKKSYADAVRAKRTNIEITDGISSDGLGRFPDLNVGEALQRIPGIQLNREAEGRQASINLRGMPGNYARLTLNGQAIAAPPIQGATGGSDGAAMGSFNSDIFSAFMIEKSPMANAPAGGLSGNIDMQIAPALSRKDGGFFKAALEYNTLGSLSSPAYTLGYNKHLSRDFAVFGTVAYKKENFRRDELRFNGYSRLNPTNTGLSNAQFASQYGSYYSATGDSCSGVDTCSLSSVLGTSDYNTAATGTSGQKGLYVLNTLRQYTRMNVGELWTASAGMEWRPNDNTKLGLTGFYTDRNLPDTVQYFQINSFWDGAGTVSPVGTPVMMSDGRALYQTVTWNNYPGKSSTRLYSQHAGDHGLFANAEWHNEDWNLTGVLASSSGTNTSSETELDLVTNSIPGGNGLSTTISNGLGHASAVSQVITPTPQNVIFAMPFHDATGGAYQPGYWNWTAGDQEDLYTADGRYTLNVSGTVNKAWNSVDAAQFDAERQLHFGPVTSIQAGVRLEKDGYHERGFRNMAYGIQSDKITQSMIIAPPGASDFMDGKVAISSNWQAIDPFAFLSAVRPVSVWMNHPLSSTGLNNYYEDGAYYEHQFDIESTLTSAYVQAKFDTSVIGHRLRGNLGVRSEATDETYTTLSPIFANATVESNFWAGYGSPSDMSTTTYKRKYSHLLPSAIFVMDLRDDMVIRGAYYDTYVRPDPRTSNNSSYTTVTTNTQQSTTTKTVKDVNISFNNSRLKPYTASSKDLSWEWYNRPGGLISVAVFEKILKNRVEGISDPAILCPANGGGWGYGTLTWDGTFCKASSSTAALEYHINANGSYNVDKPTYVNGLELNIQQNFDFLPSFWKNFGGAFNYAFTTAKQRGAGAKAAPFPGISKFAYNAILYYETPKFGIRGVYNHRTTYPLTAAGTYTGNSRNAAERGQLDIAASYNLTDRLTLSFDGYNVTNSPVKEFEVDPRLVRSIKYDGRTYTFTLKGTF